MKGILILLMSLTVYSLIDCYDYFKAMSAYDAMFASCDNASLADGSGNVIHPVSGVADSCSVVNDPAAAADRFLNSIPWEVMEVDSIDSIVRDLISSTDYMMNHVDTLKEDVAKKMGYKDDDKFSIDEYVKDRCGGDCWETYPSATNPAVYPGYKHDYPTYKYPEPPVYQYPEHPIYPPYPEHPIYPPYPEQPIYPAYPLYPVGGLAALAKLGIGGTKLLTLPLLLKSMFLGMVAKPTAIVGSLLAIPILKKSLLLGKKLAIKTLIGMIIFKAIVATGLAFFKILSLMTLKKSIFLGPIGLLLATPVILKLAAGAIKIAMKTAAVAAVAGGAGLLYMYYYQPVPVPYTGMRESHDGFLAVKGDKTTDDYIDTVRNIFDDVMKASTR